MKLLDPNEDQLKMIRNLLSYQFDEKVANAFIKLPIKISLRLGKLRYVYLEEKRIMTMRPTDYGFTISLEAGKIILENSDPPRYRVIARNDVDYRGDVMGIDVISSDPLIRPGDEVVIIDYKGQIIGVGKARAPGFMMASLGKGEAVRLREKVQGNG
ncbi:MAG: PUA domain-containing protein [Caldisphaera sp.]|jgi:archaeosine-15-forming tRNA-guanine transglycosylase|nr:prefoldin subunit alpha [Caldisphaera sp.]PMP88285.1 MAG: prefoldin subunit alpha [Caldisphaera sp.]